MGFYENLNLEDLMRMAEDDRRDEEYLCGMYGSQDPNPEREWEDMTSGIFPF